MGTIWSRESHPSHRQLGYEVSKLKVVKSKFSPLVRTKFQKFVDDKLVHL